ncbi:M13 family metallopeptidase [Hymenobacter sp. 5516J-16]|uniref:M13 family metallopeptidase n=1 Tax=Hymenobacter sublimis TaxID=2933777 RepID=A0ABY4J8M2_9BACT|nr:MULTISPECIES: M13 family metallopeptidase [Hymenobacter]UOQ79000.1 M13 family metallopeptidase [Hymenobacter sp. 5516J-16]UPL48945.1 M13 family metallopeptidase [Hymenobacter sublimis]
MKNRSASPRAGAAALLLTLAGCATSQPTTTATTATPAAASTATPVASTSGGRSINPQDVDRSVSPCEDFFQFSGGNWLKNNPVPAYASSWGPRNLLGDRTQATLKRILEEAAANTSAAKGSNAQKVGDFYASGMDSAAIEKAGLTYLQPELKRISAVKDLKSLQTELARQQRLGTGAFFRAGVGPDRKQSTVYAVNLSQGGLSMPDRDYYLKDDARSKTVRTAYVAYMTNTFKLMGDSEATAAQKAATILRLETRLAKASKDRVALRDPNASYNKMTLAEANTQFPNIGLPTLLAQNGLGAAKEVIVGQPDFFREVSALLKEEPLSDVKTYLTWQLVSSLPSALPKAYSDEAFRFQQVQSGAKQQPVRWKRMQAATDATLGEAFGQLYVDKAFSPEAKRKALEMVANIKASMAEHIQTNTWMSDATKAEALKKLNALRVKIGYPDKWKDYSELSISRESYLKNVLAAREWGYKQNVKKFGGPIDRNEWGMTPPTINAYYNPPMNEIVFPAGYLQPPFFDPEADDAVNYGAIGGVMGHEMTHGFDDQGRQYDSEGNLRDWWTKADGEEFTKRAAVVGRQYDAFSPLDSVHVNGKLTMGENLADFAGLTIVYGALQKQLDKTYGKGNRPLIDGFTPEQRFFLSWAQLRRQNIRPAALRQQILTDPHSPGQYRTIGPLMNMPAFYQAFGCQQGQKMVRPDAERAVIW